MADQSVEIVGARGSGVDLVIRDLGLLAQIQAQSLGHARRLFERSSIGHVNHHLELALVVEGQHFHPHPLQRDEPCRDQQQHHHAAQKHPAAFGIEDERIHDAPVYARRPAFRLARMGGTGTLARGLSQQAQRRPGRHYKRNDQRKQHRRRRSHRDRPHVRPHQPSHKRHRKDGRDHGEGRENRRIPDLVHGFDREIGKGTPLVLWQAEMSHDVFDDDDGIVHEDADRKNQRE